MVNISCKLINIWLSYKKQKKCFYETPFPDMLHEICSGYFVSNVLESVLVCVKWILKIGEYWQNYDHNFKILWILTFGEQTSLSMIKSWQ